MNNITLICTKHSENGACNVNELYKIIQNINPEVIFEELPPSAFNDYYVRKSKTNLETTTINKYLECHKIEHIPIDYEGAPDSIFKDNAFLHKRVESKSHQYRYAMDNHSLFVNRYGFKYLNSAQCVNDYKEVYNAIEEFLESENDEKLVQIYKSWNDIIRKRDIEMISNIYKYCNNHSFNRGLFFIGAAHRESIIDLIQSNVANDKDNCICWNYSCHDGIL